MATKKGKNQPVKKSKIIPAPEAKIIPAPEAEIIPAPEAEIIPAPEAEIIPAPEVKIIPAPEVKIIPASEIIEVSKGFDPKNRLVTLTAKETKFTVSKPATGFCFTGTEKKAKIIYEHKLTCSQN